MLTEVLAVLNPTGYKVGQVITGVHGRHDQAWRVTSVTCGSYDRYCYIGLLHLGSSLAVVI